MTDALQSREDYIAHWVRSLSILHAGHWSAARFYTWINLVLGVLAAIVAAISGTAIMSDTEWKSLAGVFSLLAAVLSAVQTFLRPSESATQHKQTGVKFGQLERELEGYLDLGIPEGAHEREKLLKPLHARWNQVEDEAVPMPQFLYKRAVKMHDENEKQLKKAKSH